jgi:hypothetical protein
LALGLALPGLLRTAWGTGHNNNHFALVLPYSSTVPDVRPLYYAMYAFTAATANASVLLGCNVTSTNELVKVWAVEVRWLCVPGWAAIWSQFKALSPPPRCLSQGPDGGQLVVIIHKDHNATSAADVAVLPAARSHAISTSAPPGVGRLARLVASDGGVNARYGVSFGGLTWDGSTDGKPRGTPAFEPVPFARGAWRFQLPPATAAVLFLP